MNGRIIGTKTSAKTTTSNVHVITEEIRVATRAEKTPRNDLYSMRPPSSGPIGKRLAPAIPVETMNIQANNPVWPLKLGLNTLTAGQIHGVVT